jgi:hypothetical protein
MLIKDVTSTAILDKNSFNKTFLSIDNHNFNKTIIKSGLFILNVTQKIKEKQIKGSCNQRKKEQKTVPKIMTYLFILINV